MLIREFHYNSVTILFISVMGIPKENFKDRDIFFEYDFEEVLFRYDHKSREFYCKHYGGSLEQNVKFNNRLLNDSMLFGEEIDETAYEVGKPKS